MSNNKQYGEVEQVNVLEQFIGKTFREVVNMDDEELHFILEDGTKYIFYHEQDCCETVMIEDICGDLSCLYNSPITMAEECIHENLEDGWDSKTYTFYKFATAKGYVTIRWCGESNGYYSESVYFKIVDIDGNLVEV